MRIQRQWKLSLLVFLFMPLLISLGFWQLDRAQEKQLLLEEFTQQYQLPAKKIEAIDLSVSQQNNYQHVIVSGSYDNDRYWLLDNQPREGKVGYEIIMPFWTGEQWLLVNRGWVLSPIYRDQLPEFTTPEGDVTIEGYFFGASKNAVFTQTASDLKQEWPKRVLQLDHVQVEKALGGNVAPLPLRVTDSSPGAFITQWPVINTLPEKHQGYAVQWFAMAFALLLLYGWALVASDREDANPKNNNKK